MSQFRSLRNRQELLEWITKTSTRYPILSCDFYLSVIDPQSTNGDSLVPVTGFSFPNAGITFSPSNEMYGHLLPTFSTSSVVINFISLTTESSVFKDLWNAQYDGGVPKFISISELPSFVIYNLVTNEEVLRMNGCRVSYPTPSINISSDSLAIYSTTVSFDNFIMQ